MTKSELLAITSPEKLFTSEDSIDKTYKHLAHIFHPDKGGDNEAFMHLNSLHSLGLQKIKNGTWDNGYVTVVLDGTEYKYFYHTTHDTDTGVVFTGNKSLLLKFSESKFATHYQRILENVTYASKEMEKEFKKFLPLIIKKSDTAMSISKTAEVMNLQDVIDYCGGRIPDKHAAWIISRLLNLICFLKYQGLRHNDLQPKNLYISAPHHTIMIYGGWEMCTKSGDTLKTVPVRTYNLMSKEEKDMKISSDRLMVAQVKSIAAQILDPVNAPEALLRWSKFPALSGPVKEYSDWQTKVLVEGYGKRKFIKWDITPEMVYKKLSK